MAISRKKSHKDDMTEYDENMAWELQRTYNTLGLTENAVFPEHLRNSFQEPCENYKPRTLIDQTLEIIDPTPNIYTLFTQFNVRFFSNKLLSVEVKWSQRMTSCAGVCSFHPRSRDCIISLSAPLLKLRPRKDLVETLLHEMIHGYLFLTNNNRDRDGHGPEFCKIMNRINQEAGTNISIYHSFHDEVRLYQQHWWRCNGPCQKRPPYFGTVRRAMNRAPGPSDFWYEAHRQSCDGTFIKIREPEKTQKPPRSKSRNPAFENPKIKKTSPTNKPDKILDNWLTKPWTNSSIPGSTNGTNISKKNSGSSNIHVQTGKPVPAGLVKLGTSTNNVHGWGTGGPKTSSPRTPNLSNSKTNKSPMINFAGTIGGNNTGRSNLLDKFSSPTISHRPKKNQGSCVFDDSPPAKKSKVSAPKTEISQNPPKGEFCHCPICNSMIAMNLLNDHLDFCLVESGSDQDKKRSTVVEIFDSPEKNRGPGKTKSPLKGQTNLDSFVESPKKNIVSCPACNKSVPMERLYDHLDRCSFDDREMGSANFPGYENPGPSSSGSRKNFVDLTEKTTSSRKDYVCLVCNVMINGDIALKDHLDDCVQAIFKDDTFDVGNESLETIDSQKNEPTIEKFPCPICMDMIRESKMNEHLDKCLASQNYVYDD